jgi:hypothetical protein
MVKSTKIHSHPPKYGYMLITSTPFDEVKDGYSISDQMKSMCNNTLYTDPHKFIEEVNSSIREEIRYDCEFGDCSINLRHKDESESEAEDESESEAEDESESEAEDESESEAEEDTRSVDSYGFCNKPHADEHKFPLGTKLTIAELERISSLNTYADKSNIVIESVESDPTVAPVVTWICKVNIQ